MKNNKSNNRSNSNNKESEQKEKDIMGKITGQMKQHLERLCEQEEVEDFLRAFRVEPEVEEGERYLLYVYPLWEAEICEDGEAFYRLWKKGYRVHGRIEEKILDIYKHADTGYSAGEHRQVDYDTYKDIFLRSISEDGFLEKYFTEKGEDIEAVREQIRREMENESSHIADAP